MATEGIAYYPKRHLAPVPVPNTTPWQNDGQNYVWDRNEGVWRTWALGNPDWTPQSGFPATGWIAYKGPTLDTMQPEDGVFIEKDLSLNSTFWSGSCYVDWENRLGHGEGAAFYYISGIDPFEQGIELLIAPKLGEKPINVGMCCSPDIVPVSQRDGDRNFRDARVFWDDDNNQLVMATTIGDRFFFLRSLNGTEWEALSTFKGPGPLVECPNMYKLSVFDEDGNDTGIKKWVILGAVQGLYAGSTDANESCVAFIGDWDGFRFYPSYPIPQPLDYGPDSYASVAGQKDKDGDVYYGNWIGNWNYSLLPSPYNGFQNIQGFPRKAWIAPDYNGVERVYTMPVDITPGDDTIVTNYEPRTFGQNKDDILKIAPGEAYRVDITLNQIDGVWPDEITIKFRSGTVNGRKFFTELVITEEGEIIFDREKSSQQWPGYPNLPPEDWTATYQIPSELSLNAGTSLTLTAIVDSSSVEAFVNGGQAALTGLIFPPEGCGGLEIEATSPVSATLSTTSL